MVSVSSELLNYTHRLFCSVAGIMHFFNNITFSVFNNEFQTVAGVCKGFEIFWFSSEKFSVFQSFIKNFWLYCCAFNKCTETSVILRRAACCFIYFSQKCKHFFRRFVFKFPHCAKCNSHSDACIEFYSALFQCCEIFPYHISVTRFKISGK